jgi:Ca2+-dependent lipid-binding protein
MCVQGGVAGEGTGSFQEDLNLTIFQEFSQLVGVLDFEIQYFLCTEEKDNPEGKEMWGHSDYTRTDIWNGIINVQIDISTFRTSPKSRYQFRILKLTVSSSLGRQKDIVQPQL